MTNQNVPIILAVITGLCFGGSWWVYTDGVIAYNGDGGKDSSYHYAWIIPGIVTTLSMIFMNIVSMTQVRTQWEGRLWLFITLTIGVLGLCGAVWILANRFSGQEWTGISLVVQCMLLIMGGIIYFLRTGFGSNEDEMFIL